MKILGEDIEFKVYDYGIHELKFLKDNPRVYACTHGEPNFDTLHTAEQQKIIFEKLKNEPSVKKLEPEIKLHGGIMEPILVRCDKMEVIEGNSRLAVYRKLDEESKSDETWGSIPCMVVSKLTKEQEAAYLNQIHVKGKTQWSPYEKANFAYIKRTIHRWETKKIADLFGESSQVINTRIKIIDMMKKNNDNKLKHFSYYDVLVRSQPIARAMQSGKDINKRLKKKLLKDIRDFDSDEENNSFTAQELRDKLPVVLRKPNTLKRYVGKKIELDEAYQSAKISSAEDKVKRARSLLDSIERTEILGLEIRDFNAFKHAVRKLSNEIKRISNILETYQK